MKSKFLISILVISAIFVFTIVFIFIYLESMQKDTCKHIIERTLAFAIHQKKVQLETSLDSNWKEFDSIQRKQLLDFAKENVRQDTECRDYSYLIRGEESGGSELPILVKNGYLDRIEVQLGE